MKIKIVLLLALFLNAMLLTKAVAQTSVFISDFSFEGFKTNISASGIASTKTGTIGAWTGTVNGLISGTSTISNGLASAFGLASAPNGSYVVQLSLPAGVGASADLKQTLSSSLVANSIYTLSFSVDPASATVLLANNTVNLLAGATTVATGTLTGLTSGVFQTFTLTYTTGASPTAGLIGIDFNSAATAGSSGALYLDNVQLSYVPTPEPSTMGLTALGFGLLALKWRFPRKDSKK